MICANTTDSNDCDLFVIANLNAFSLNYFKIIPN